MTHILRELFDRIRLFLTPSKTTCWLVIVLLWLFLVYRHLAVGVFKFYAIYQKSSTGLIDQSSSNVMNLTFDWSKMIT